MALGRGPERSIAEIKRLLNDAETAEFEDHLMAERDTMSEVVGGDEAAEGIRAFLEKRKPVFR